MEKVIHTVYNRDAYNFLINYLRKLSKHSCSICYKIESNKYVLDFSSLPKKHRQILKAPIQQVEIIYEQNEDLYTLYGSHIRIKYLCGLSTMLLNDDISEVDPKTFEIIKPEKINLFAGSVSIQFPSNRELILGKYNNTGYVSSKKIAEKNRKKLIENKKVSTQKLIDKHTEYLNYLNTL